MKGCCSATICWTLSQSALRFLSEVAAACGCIRRSLSASQAVAGLDCLGFHWWFSAELSQTFIWLLGSRSVLVNPRRQASLIERGYVHLDSDLRKLLLNHGDH